MRAKGLPERMELLLAILLVGFLAFVYSVALRAPGIGLFHDDGLYVVTAKSLAEGHGYRIISLPGEPPQTKYPVLFPLTLAVVWKFRPAFPQNVIFLKLVPLLFTLLWCGLLFRYFRQEHFSSREAFWIVVLTAASPWTLFFSATLMAETLFACLATAALLCLSRFEKEPGSAGWIVVLASALLAAAAFHARTVALALIGAVFLSLLLQKRFRYALAFLLICVLLALPWLAWQASYGTAAAQSFPYYSSANYAGWNIVFNFALAQKVTVFLQNLLYLLLSPALLFGFSLAAPSSVFFLLAFNGLVCLGFWLDARRRFGSLHLFVILYCGLILAWAWPPVRFALPIFPFLLFFAWKGFAATYSLVTGRERVSAVVAWAILICLVSSTVYSLTLTMRNTLVTEAASFPVTPQDKWKDLSAMQEWIRGNTPSKAILLSMHDPVIYLCTGRRALRGFVANPFELFYAHGPRRPLGGQEMLLEQIARHKVSYLVRTPNSLYREGPYLNQLIEEAVTQHPNAFTVVYEGGSPGYRIYRVDLTILGSMWNGGPRISN